MVTIQKIGKSLPRHQVPYFKENPEVFKKFRNKEEVEVPDELASLPGVRVVVKESKKSRKALTEDSTPME